VLFPERMSRLVWLVPESRLGESLAWLARHHRFQLHERLHLGEERSMHDLRARFEAGRRYTRHRRARMLLTTIPDKPLLQYRLGECTDGAPAGTLHLEDLGLFLWIGTGEPPEGVREYLLPEPLPEPPSMPLSLPDEQWQLLFSHAAAIGHVGSWAIIDGWLPRSETCRLEKRLGAEGEAFVLTPAESSGLDMETVPVLYRRPAWLSGFGRLMGLFGATGYREIDPTLFLAFGFVLMFGMMFADLGQGLLLAAAGAALLGCGGGRREVGQVLVPVGLSAALFGWLFGVCFAREDLITPLWFRPREAILLYLGASAALGIVTILFGLLLGQVNAWREGRWRERLWGPFGFIGLMFYLLLIAAVAAWLLHMNEFGRFAALAAAGVLVLVFVRCMRQDAGQAFLTRVMVALIESYDLVMRYVAQTFSFTRIAAFSIAHVALSTVVVLAADSVSSTWAVWAVMGAGNAVIIALEGLIVAIQTLRLNFFEFFTKFVQASGRLFTPLALRGTG